VFFQAIRADAVGEVGAGPAVDEKVNPFPMVIGLADAIAVGADRKQAFQLTQAQVGADAGLQLVRLKAWVVNPRASFALYYVVALRPLRDEDHSSDGGNGRHAFELAAYREAFMPASSRRSRIKSADLHG
jgi:hypothetical protein